MISFFRFAMKRFARSAQHARSRCFDLLHRSEHTALFERARGRGSGKAAQEWWCSIGWLAGLRCLAAGRLLHPICPRSVQGKWELEGDNRRFRPRGARGRSPAPTMGVHPRGGGVLPAGFRIRSKTRSPSASPLITRNRFVLCGACAPAAPPGREPLRRRGSLPAPLSPVAPLRGESASPLSTGPGGRRA